MKLNEKKELSLAGCAIWILAMMFTCSTALAEEKSADTGAAEESPTAAATEDSGAATLEKAGAKSGEDSFAAAGGKFLTISGGYVISDYEDSDADVTGWRINALFEMNPKGGNVLQGLSVGYIETSGERTSGAQTVEYEVMTIPVCYAPKLLFGKKAFKGFVKGMLGFHYSDYSRTGTGTSASTDDAGFYGGGGLGGMLVLKEKFFVNVEYEAAYLSNSYYRDGIIQTAMFGIGMKF